MSDWANQISKPKPKNNVFDDEIPDVPEEELQEAINQSIQLDSKLIERLDELCIFAREVKGFRNKFPGKKVLNNKKELTKLFFDHYLKVATLEDLTWIDQKKITDNQVEQLRERIAYKKRQMNMPIESDVTSEVSKEMVNIPDTTKDILIKKYLNYAKTMYKVMNNQMDFKNGKRPSPNQLEVIKEVSKL